VSIASGSWRPTKRDWFFIAVARNRRAGALIVTVMFGLPASRWVIQKLSKNFVHDAER
jgi:hypothetical protein